MTFRRLLCAALLCLTLLAPLAGAQGAQPVPAGAHALNVGNATLSYWFGTADAVNEDVNMSQGGDLWFSVLANESRLVVYLNVTAASVGLHIPNGTLVLDAAANTTATTNVTATTIIADAGRVNQSYTFAGELYRETNGTLTLLAPFSGSGSFIVDVGTFLPAPTPPAGGIPTTWLMAGAALLVVGGGATAILVRQRNIKRRMNEGPKRSVVMRELELEKKLEKAKDPEQVQEIKQEIRQQETVREKRRELQILEAKRADAVKTLDLLKKRHEAGGLTKLQYDNMAAKKQADLHRLDAEIAQMEREDAAGGAAA